MSQKQSGVELPSIEKLIEAGQPQFGVFKQVKHINYLDYHSHLISQKPVAIWRKQFKANQFAFIQIVHAPYRVCMAVATIKLATSAFAYLYNDETGEFEIVEGLTPLTLNSQLKGDHQHGTLSFKSRDINILMQFEPDTVEVKLDSSLFAVDATLTRGDNPLAICSPSGRRGWTFTQKEPFSAVQGSLSIGKDSKHSASTASSVEFDESSHANLDWTLGFMRHETNWFWACINSQLADSRHFALNLSMGVNETGVSENACWIDGKIVYLPPVMFRRGQNKGVWRIANQNVGWSTVDVDLTFTPISVYQKTDNYGPVASIFEQWVGHYSGTITLGDDVVELHKVMGLAEDHFAKW